MLGRRVQKQNLGFTRTEQVPLSIREAINYSPQLALKGDETVLTCGQSVPRLVWNSLLTLNAKKIRGINSNSVLLTVLWREKGWRQKDQQRNGLAFCKAFQEMMSRLYWSWFRLELSKKPYSQFTASSVTLFRHFAVCVYNLGTMYTCSF